MNTLLPFSHIPFNKNNTFCKLVKNGEDYTFKWCDINGNVKGHKQFEFPSRLIDFNQSYVKDLSDLKPDLIYVIAKSKLLERFNSNNIDYLHNHPAEIREYNRGHNLQNGTVIPVKLIENINHEYGLFRDSAVEKRCQFR